MEIAVLVKAVPRSEAIRYEADRRVTVRDGVELVLNPFDQRALRVAVDLRAPGDRVTVVSLGPPSVGPLLREALAAGADRAVHLCHEAFAGSDLLATSEVLATFLQRLGPGLVLAGARSTDSETGLVGPEVAARLGLAIVTGARAIRRTPGSSGLTVAVDTPTGWASASVALPTVVTVGEKIGKPLPVAPEQFDRVPPAGVEVLGPDAVGLAPSEVGAFASPTTVEDVREVAPLRRGRRFADGPIPRRVDEAVRALGPLLAGRPPVPPPLPWPPAASAEHELAVLASVLGGATDPDAPGLVTFLRRALPAYTVLAVSYGPGGAGPSWKALEAAGALGGLTLDPGPAPFDSSDVAEGLDVLLDRRPKLAAVVAAATPFGREVAGQLAARRSLGAVGDAIDVRASEDGRLAWSKPSFGGGRIATVRCRSTPTVATMPPGLASAATEAPAGAGLVPVSIRVPVPRGRVRRGPEQVEPAEAPEPGGADVVVAVGAGVGGPEGIERLAPVLRRWGAALVATRRVVDAGWMPARRQVGLTGRFLAPRLAVLLGVRGAVNHMVGWSRTKAVLAINRDAEAPVFAQADVGIVGTVDDVLPVLVEPLAHLLRSPSGG